MQIGCTDCFHCICFYTCCLAGHGDNDFREVNKEEFEKFMNDENLKDYLKQQLIESFPEYNKD